MGMNRILTARMFDTLNDLPPVTRASVIELLNERLADVIDLELQAKQAHWNSKGPHFVGLHELFDRVALQAREYADELAERAVALGGVARGTIEEIAGQSTLPAYPLVVDDWRTHADMNSLEMRPVTMLATASMATMLAMFFDWRRRFVRRLTAGAGAMPLVGEEARANADARPADLTSNQIDDALADSFPASDPPAWTPGVARLAPGRGASPAWA
jgi:DNA-binding ferritin-like protein